MRRALLVAVALFAVPTGAAFQELPVRELGLRQGLPNSRVNFLLRDRLGYLWLATWEGIARFDGRSVESFGAREGLANPLVWSLAQDRAGNVWAATHGGGLARLRLDGGGPARFEGFPLGERRAANTVYELYVDAQGSLWCAAQDSLWRCPAPGMASPRFEEVARIPDLAVSWNHFAQLARGVLLVLPGELLEIRADGVLRHPWPAAKEDGEPCAVARDEHGRILIAHERALYAVREEDLALGAPQRLALELGAGQRIRALAADGRGGLWIGTRDGLLYRTGEGLREISTAQGLADDWIRCLLTDADGGVWIGTHLGGACRLASLAAQSWTRRAGLEIPDVAGLVESSAGGVLASTTQRGLFEIRAGNAAPVAGSTTPPFQDSTLHVLQDRRGRWWVGSSRELWLFEGPELSLAGGLRLGEEHGYRGGGAFGAMREGPDGRVWIPAWDGNLYAADVAGEPRVEPLDLSALGLESPPRAVVFDSAGNLWLAANVGLWRRRGGSFEAVVPDPSWGAGEVAPRSLRVDRRGRLWIGFRFRGLAVCADPTAATPVFRTFSTREGLSSDAVMALSEDGRGRILLGTARGLDVLDPDSGAVHHFGVADGLAGDLVHACLVGRDGAVWVGTTGGLTRLDSTPERAPRAPPRVYYRRVSFGGVEQALPAGGAAQVGELEIGPAGKSLWVEAVALDEPLSADLRFQFRLEGVEEDWSAPSEQREVRYASLAPGRHRLLARALARDGTPSEPATLSFRLLPPIWRRGWFALLALASLGGAIFALHRARVRRALALERVRTQIASDLHDDLGASLAQIAILSEVARRDASAAQRDSLGEIAGIARSARASIGDIVWSIDPRRDRLADLVHRMRQSALALVDPSGAALEFRAPPDEAVDRVALGPDRRRHLLLFLKEAAANAARHARAARVEIDVSVNAGRLELSISDDGAGFDPLAPAQGHGLQSLRRRAEELGGELALDSAPGRGTRIRLEVPLA